jgi:hypothetical protein
MHKLQTLEGPIEHLYTGQMRVDILKQYVNKGAQGTAAAIQAATGNIGMASTSASVAMSDTDEQMEVFGFWVGDHMVQGMLPYVTFKNDDVVKVVFEQVGSEKKMCAIWRRADDMLWMPLMMGWGLGPIFKQAVKHALWVFLIVFTFYSTFFYFSKEPADQADYLMTTAVSIGLSLIFGVWDFLGFRAHGQLSTNIFKALGLPNSTWLDLRPYSLLMLNHDLTGECVYDLKAMRSAKKI